MLMQSLIVLLMSFNFGYSELNDYFGYKKFYVQHTNADVYEHMVELSEMVNSLDFWLLSKNLSIVLVPPRMDRVFQRRMAMIGAAYNETLLSDDEDETCDVDCPKRRSKRQSRGFFGSFQRYNTIVRYLQYLSKKYAHIAKFEDGSYTAEGRRIAMIRIAPNRRVGNKLIYIQGGSHAREWISPSTVLYFVAELLRNFNYYKHLLRDTELCVVPLLNPDGYELSHTQNRLWRKNNHYSFNSFCRGVDLNRNFGFKWGVIGASRNPCSDLYAGRIPFSENETSWVRRFLLKNQYRTKLVLDVHSFGNYLFYPWGYRLGGAPTRSTLHSIGLRVARAIYNYRGTKYAVGSSADLLYQAAGSLDDYAYGALGIPLAYTFELPGNSFQVDAREIVPIGKETFVGFLEFIRIVNLMK